MKEPLAYKAMFEFLDGRYKQSPSDALGSLLGDLQVDEDGEPFDPAMAAEWDRAVASSEKNSRLQTFSTKQRLAS